MHGPFAAINADDFYGAETFRAASEFLREANDASHPAHFAMVAFRLGRTLSEHGTVARGVCAVGNAGMLRGIEEMTDIAREADGRIVSAGRVLKEDTLVSMNFWAFTTQLFPLLEKELGFFLADHADSEKAECYLPSAITAMIRSGSAEVRVFETASDWFGVTYREDRERVVQSIAVLVRSGDYPG